MYRSRHSKNQTLKIRLQTLIKARGESEKEFYKALGYSKQVWYALSWGVWETSIEHKVRIARALNVDRRVVIETARAIASDEKLLHIFFKLEPRAFIGNAAKEFGFDSIEIRADAKKKGIVAAVTKLLAEEGVVIRQIVTDDPELYPDPVLTIVIDGRLNSKLIKELKELDFAEKVMLK